MAKGIDYLRAKLAEKKPGVNLRYAYYDMKQTIRDFGISTPPDLRTWMSTMGWCAKAVDVLADRLRVWRFEDDLFDINGIYNRNMKHVLFDSAIKAAMISSCSFIYIRQGEDDFPVLQVLEGSRATGIMDERTGMLTEGYAVLEQDAAGMPVTEGYFEPGHTTFYQPGRAPWTVDNPAPWPLLVPVVNRPDAKRPFGHSVISRACMSLMGSAIRTVKRSEIAAEFYSYPQKYVTGLAQDAERMDKWKSTMSAMMTFTKDEDGDKPTPGQFSQQSMQPHCDQIRLFASLFAGETGLTLDDLGFVSDNPSSADAIKASHETLRLKARKAQEDIGNGLINAGYLAACLRDDYAYSRDQLYMTTIAWDPVFEPDVSQLGMIGDAIIKLAQAAPGYLSDSAIHMLTGIKGANE